MTRRKKAKPEKSTRETAAEWCANHRLTVTAETPDVLVLRFAQPDKWAYGFKLVWVPGHIFVGGDIGEFTLTHYAAMPTAQDALGWLTSSYADYLLGKSTIKQEIDVDKTIARVREWRNRENDREHRKALSLLLDELNGCDAHSVPHTLYESGLTDDFYGSYVWPWNRLVQVEMIKLAGAAWLATLRKEAA